MPFLPDSSTYPPDRPPLPVASEKVTQGSIYPFSLTEVVFLTENNDYCEQMVRQWIAHHGKLQNYYNMSMNSKAGLLPAITSASSFFSLVEQLGKIDAKDEFEMVAKLDKAYDVQGSPDKLRYHKIHEDEELITISIACPSKAMMHLSLRKKPISSGGHAIGIARSGDIYYLYDPNSGMFKVQGQDRLKEVLANGFTGPQPPQKLAGPWAEYVYFHSVLVPDTLDANL